MTSLHSRTRVCRHTVVCGRLVGGMGLGAIPGASPFLPPSAFWWGGVLLRSAARRACVLLSCRVWCVFPGWRAWWVGWRFGRLLRIFLVWCVIWNCCAPWLLAPSGSLCGVLRGVESLVCVLGRLRRENQRGARTARFSWVFGSYGGRVALHGFCGGDIVTCGGWR